MSEDELPKIGSISVSVPSSNGAGLKIMRGSFVDDASVVGQVQKFWATCTRTPTGFRSMLTNISKFVEDSGLGDQIKWPGAAEFVADSDAGVRKLLLFEFLAQISRALFAKSTRGVQDKKATLPKEASAAALLRMYNRLTGQTSADPDVPDAWLPAFRVVPLKSIDSLFAPVGSEERLQLLADCAAKTSDWLQQLDSSPAAAEVKAGGASQGGGSANGGTKSAVKIDEDELSTHVVEMQFVLRSHVRSEADLTSTRKKLQDADSALKEIESAATEFKVNTGAVFYELVRTAKLQSGGRLGRTPDMKSNSGKSFQDRVDLSVLGATRKARLVQGVQGMMNLIRIKIADSNDLVTTKRAVEESLGVLSRLETVAGQQGLGMWEAYDKYLHYVPKPRPKGQNSGNAGRTRSSDSDRRNSSRLARIPGKSGPRLRKVVSDVATFKKERPKPKRPPARKASGSGAKDAIKE